jgi:hypothetical protein
VLGAKPLGRKCIQHSLQPGLDPAGVPVGCGGSSRHRSPDALGRNPLR